MKVDLEFDIESLRIRDLGDDEEYQQFKKQSSSIYDQIKAKSLRQILQMMLLWPTSLAK